MYVTKRNGKQEEVHFQKIKSRIQKLCYGLNQKFVDPTQICMKVIAGLYRGVKTVELDNLAAETAATMTTLHPDYATLAARIAISNLHKQTKKCFSGNTYYFIGFGLILFYHVSKYVIPFYISFIDVMNDLHNLTDKRSSRNCPMLSDKFVKIVNFHAEKLNSSIVYDRDFSYNYFGFKVSHIVLSFQNQNRLGLVLLH